MIRAGLVHFSLHEEDRADLPKGDPRKLAIARVVRVRSAVSHQWLADALKLKHANMLNHATSRNTHVAHLSAIREKAIEYKKRSLPVTTRSQEYSSQNLTPI